MILQLRHRQPGITAGIDALKRLHVHVHMRPTVNEASPRIRTPVNNLRRPKTYHRQVRAGRARALLTAIPPPAGRHQRLLHGTDQNSRHPYPNRRISSIKISKPILPRPVVSQPEPPRSP